MTIGNSIALLLFLTNWPSESEEGIVQFEFSSTTIFLPRFSHEREYIHYL